MRIADGVVEVLQAFRLDEEQNTLTSATGADFAPEFLYGRVSQRRG